MNQTIAELNDKFRRYEDTSLGRYMMTRAVHALALEKQYQLVQLVRDFDCFTKENDPYCERNFGEVTMDDETYYWKIDYYDPTLKFGSENPADPSLTKRVMTIMHSSER